MNTLLLTYKQSDLEYFDWSEVLSDTIDELAIPITFVGADTIDDALHGFVIDQIAGRSFDLIIIPVSITNAYYAYTGVRLAMHLRLTRDTTLGEKRYVPIVLTGFESELQHYKLSEYAAFLKTPSVYYVNQSVGAVKNLLSKLEGNYKPVTDAACRLDFGRRWAKKMAGYSIEVVCNDNQNRRLLPFNTTTSC